MMTNGNELMSQMDTLSKGLESYLSGLEAQITNQATQMGTQMAAQVQAWADGAAAQLNQEATAAAQSAADAAAARHPPMQQNRQMISSLQQRLHWMHRFPQLRAPEIQSLPIP